MADFPTKLILGIVATLVFGASCAYAEDDDIDPPILLDDAFEQAISVDDADDVGDADRIEPETDSPGAIVPVDDSRDVSTRELQGIDPAAVGTLDPADGGFPSDMWAGSSRALVESLIPRLPVATASASMQSLVRRLLLTRAAVPEGPSTHSSMLALRAERLLAAGRARDVVQLIGRASVPADEPDVVHARAEALMLSGDFAAACALAEIMMRESDDSYWLKVAIPCRAEAGDRAGAGLALELLHEQGMEDAGYLSLAAELVTPGDDKPVTVDTLDPLRLEILRAIGGPFPAAAVNTAIPSVLAALSRDQSLDLDLRLAIAERAESVGALSSEDLGHIYRAVAFPPDDVSMAIDTAKANPGPRSNALLYQFVTGDRPDEDRYEALRALWRLGEKGGNLGTLARVTHAVAAGIAPAEDLSWLAPDLTRALLISGDPEAAMAWYNTLSDEARARLWPLLAIADREGVVAPPQRATTAWLRTLSDLVAGQRRARARLAFVLVEAAGRRVPDDDWRDLVGEAGRNLQPVDPAVLRLLESASADRHIGEAVIYALLALGPQGPARAHPLTLARVYRALTALDLTHDAQRIAIEAMVGNGL